MVCPVPDAHRRLDDAHAEWHDALDAYFDPHKFRRTFNSFLASVQSTIDTISRKKRVVPGGQQKLNTWKSAVSSDRIFKWADKARNLVIHEADLSLHSVAWMEYTSPRHQTFRHRLDVQPETPSDALLAAFLMEKPEMVKAGIVRVSRKWIANTLPDVELLEAGTHLYEQIAALVSAFHSEADGDCSDLALPARECHTDGDSLLFPVCMPWAGQAPITRVIDIESRRELILKVARIRRDPNVTVEHLREHYGDFVGLVGDPIQAAPQQLRSASLFLTVDSEVLPWVVLYRGANIIDSFPLSFHDGASKLALYRMLTDKVEVSGADGFMWTGEAWTSHQMMERKVHMHEQTFYDIKPNRGEAILVVSATRDGRRLMMIRSFTRDDKGWPVLGRIKSQKALPSEWRPVVEALNGLPKGSSFRRH